MLPSLKALGPGQDPPKIIDVMIEIPKDSKIKYEVDFDSGILRVNRVLSVSVSYPCNYGFIPGTLEEDSKDPIDSYVICEALSPLSIVSCSPIGVILTEDQNGKDAKIIAVPSAAVSQSLAILMTYEILLHFLEQNSSILSNITKIWNPANL